METKDQLDGMTDQQLNELFARQVCSYALMGSIIEGVILCGVSGSAGPATFPLPSFCTNANVVLPWLEKWHITAEHVAESPFPWHVVCEDDEHCYIGRGPTFPRAAVLAVLRAKCAQPGKFD